MLIQRCLSFLLAFALTLGLFGTVPGADALTVSPVKLELRGDPGATVGSSFRLINEQDSETTFYVSFANFEAQGEDGTPSFVESGTDLATWIRLIPAELNSVTLAPGASQDIYFEVNIPEDATPGGHFAAIFWGTSPESAGESMDLGLGAKVGILTFLSVNGQVDEEGGLIEFGLAEDKKVYNTLPVDFYYRFQNDGGDRVVPQGMISIKNIFGVETDEVSANLSESNVLPLSVRRFEVSWGESLTEEAQTFWDRVEAQWDQFAFGPYKAEITLTYGTEQSTVVSELRFWAFPWQLLLVLGLSLLLVFTFGTILIRKYNRWIIAQAISAQQSVVKAPVPVRKKTSKTSKKK